MDTGGKVFASLFDPLYRLAELPGQVRYYQFFRVELDLGPKATPNVRRNHLDLVLRHAHRTSQQCAYQVRDLRRYPHRQLAAPTVIGSQYTTWLHVHRRQALLRDLQTHHLVSLAEPLIGHANGFIGRLGGRAEDAEHDVVVELVVHLRGTGLGRLLRIDHSWQDIH